MYEDEDNDGKYPDESLVEVECREAGVSSLRACPDARHGSQY
jgi:hypothetical protein